MSAVEAGASASLRSRRRAVATLSTGWFGKSEHTWPSSPTPRISRSRAAGSARSSLAAPAPDRGARPASGRPSARGRRAATAASVRRVRSSSPDDREGRAFVGPVQRDLRPVHGRFAERAEKDQRSRPAAEAAAERSAATDPPAGRSSAAWTTSSKRRVISGRSSAIGATTSSMACQNTGPAGRKMNGCLRATRTGPFWSTTSRRPSVRTRPEELLADPEPAEGEAPVRRHDVVRARRALGVARCRAPGGIRQGRAPLGRPASGGWSRKSVVVRARRSRSTMGHLGAARGRRPGTGDQAASIATRGRNTRTRRRRSGRFKRTFGSRRRSAAVCAVGRAGRTVRTKVGQRPARSATNAFGRGRRANDSRQGRMETEGPTALRTWDHRPERAFGDREGEDRPARFWIVAVSATGPARLVTATPTAADGNRRARLARRREIVSAAMVSTTVRERTAAALKSPVAWGVDQRSSERRSPGRRAGAHGAAGRQAVRPETLGPQARRPTNQARRQGVRIARTKAPARGWPGPGDPRRPKKPRGEDVIAHVVLFRPKPSLSTEQRTAFLEAIQGAFTNIPAIKRATIGRRRVLGRADDDQNREGFRTRRSSSSSANPTCATTSSTPLTPRSENSSTSPPNRPLCSTTSSSTALARASSERRITPRPDATSSAENPRAPARRVLSHRTRGSHRAASTRGVRGTR